MASLITVRQLMEVQYHISWGYLYLNIEGTRQAYPEHLSLSPVCTRCCAGFFSIYCQNGSHTALWVFICFRICLPQHGWCCCKRSGKTPHPRGETTSNMFSPAANRTTKHVASAAEAYETMLRVRRSVLRSSNRVLHEATTHPLRALRIRLVSR